MTATTKRVCASADSKRGQPAAKRPRTGKRAGACKAKSTVDMVSPFLQDLLRPHMRHSSFAATWIKLSMVNKPLRAMIHADLQLWRSIFFGSVMRWEHTSWVTNYTHTAALQCAEYKRRFKLDDRSPQRLESQTDVAPAAFYKKSVQVWHIHTCGMCGTNKHVQATWVLGMKLCRPCAQANLASQEVMWEDYGLALYSPAPSFAKTPALLAVEEEVHAAPVLTWLPMRVWFFKSECTKEPRKAYSSDPRDFIFKVHPTPFLWKPHLARYLDMPALQVWAQEKKAAAKLLTAVFQRNFAVALRNNKRYKNNKAEVVSILKLMELKRCDPSKKQHSTRLHDKRYWGDNGRILNHNQNAMPDPWLPVIRA